MLDHTGSQAVLLYSTPSAAWLQLLCPVSCVHMCMCVCCACSCAYISLAQGLSDRSCPYLYAGLRGEADLSLLKPLQRDQGWAEEVRGAGPASTAAASLGFGSWGAGTGVQVAGVEGWNGVVCVAGGEGSRRGICVRQEGRDRRHGNESRDVFRAEIWKFSFVCMCVRLCVRVCVCCSTWTDLLCSGVTLECQGCLCVHVCDSLHSNHPAW